MLLNSLVTVIVILCLLYAKCKKYRAIKKFGLNFVRLYFPNYAWYVNDLHNI